jgi:hypothetical protein
MLETMPQDVRVDADVAVFDVHALGWYPDPLERYAQRFFDGRRWTRHVADGDVIGVDDADDGEPAPAVEPARHEPSASRRAGTARAEVVAQIAMVLLLATFLVLTTIVT